MKPQKMYFKVQIFIVEPILAPFSFKYLAALLFYATLSYGLCVELEFVGAGSGLHVVLD